MKVYVCFICDVTYLGRKESVVEESGELLDVLVVALE